MLSSYDLAVGSLIVKSRVAVGLPPLTNTELAAHISVWAEITFGVIPESQLEGAYFRAMQDKEDGFPLTAPGLVKGFRANCDSDRVAPQIPQDSRLLTGDVCSKCFGTGLYVPDEKDAQGYKLPAQRCDHVPIEDPDDVSMF